MLIALDACCEAKRMDEERVTTSASLSCCCADVLTKECLAHVAHLLRGRELRL